MASAVEGGSTGVTVMVSQLDAEGSPIPNPQRKLFFGLFVFPLLIAVGMAVLLCTAVLLTHEEETPESLIAAIKTGSPSKRWQKAFELSNELNRSAGVIRDQGLMREVMHILQDRVHYDVKTRSYMAMVLRHFPGSEAVAVLRETLKDENGDAALYALWSLGVLKAREAVPDILPLLQSGNDQLRKTAVYVLGVLGDPETVVSIRRLLDDPVSDVRWNAALSLARFRDASGREVLLRMLEREQLKREHQMSASEIEKVMINALKGLALIGGPESMDALRTLAQSDQSLKVRQAAVDALRYQETVTVQPVIASEAKQSRFGIASVVPPRAGLPRNDEEVSEQLQETTQGNGFTEDLVT